MPSLWSSLADLRLRIDDYAIERREQAVSSEFTRVTTTVVLHGGGETGEGEDVTYTAADHEDFPAGEMLTGAWTFHDYSLRLDQLELFSSEPQMDASRDYRRWAFESAALDVALRQAGRSFAEVLGRPYRPLRFVASTRADIAAVPRSRIRRSSSSWTSKRTGIARSWSGSQPPTACACST